MNITKTFFINGSILTLTTLIMQSINMGFNLYIYNQIGTEAVGAFNLIMSIYIFFITISTSGLNIACTYIVSEQFSKKDFSLGLKATKTCFKISLSLSILTSLILITCSSFISTHFLQNLLSNTFLYLIALSLPFIGLSSVINSYFTAIRKAYKTAIVQFLELIIKIVSTILLLVFNDFYTIESTCTSLILGDVISEIFACLILTLLYKKSSKKIIKIYNQNKNFNFSKKILKISIPVSITSSIRSGLSAMTQFLIPNRLLLYGIDYNSALSEYGKISGVVMSMLWFPSLFIMSFNNLLIPEFARLYTQKYNKRILQICTKIFNYVSIYSIFISLIFLFFAKEINILTYNNLEYVEYFVLLAPTILFMYINTSIDNILKGLNKQLDVMICNILDLIITFIVLYFCLPNFGILGYILSIIISQLFNFTISYFQLYKATKFKLSYYMIVIYLFNIFLTFWLLGTKIIYNY